MYAFSLLGSIVGLLVIAATMLLADSAPKEAAGYAMACAFAVVPYVMARSARNVDAQILKALADVTAELRKRGTGD
jgi:hypothetical protein